MSLYFAFEALKIYKNKHENLLRSIFLLFLGVNIFLVFKPIGDSNFSKVEQFLSTFKLQQSMGAMKIPTLYELLTPGNITFIYVKFVLYVVTFILAWFYIGLYFQKNKLDKMRILNFLRQQLMEDQLNAEENSDRAKTTVADTGLDTVQEDAYDHSAVAIAQNFNADINKTLQALTEADSILEADKALEAFLDKDQQAAYSRLGIPSFVWQDYLNYKVFNFSKLLKLTAYLCLLLVFTAISAYLYLIPILLFLLFTYYVPAYVLLYDYSLAKAFKHSFRAARINWGTIILTNLNLLFFSIVLQNILSIFVANQLWLELLNAFVVVYFTFVIGRLQAITFLSLCQPHLLLQRGIKRDSEGQQTFLIMIKNPWQGLDIIDWVKMHFRTITKVSDQSETSI